MKTKKSKLFILVLTLIVSSFSMLTTPINATNTVVVNEYLMLKSEQNALKSKLSTKQSSQLSQEFHENQIKIEKFKDHIYELKNKSIDELKNYNYTDEQINAIKTYDGSEDKSIRAATTLKFSTKKNKLSYNSSNGLTTVSATVNFSWNGKPAEEYGKDSFAMAYEADNNHNFQKISTVSSSLKYKEYKSPSNVKVWTKSATKQGDQGVTGSYGWDFPFKVKGDQYYAFLTSGSFTTTGVVSGRLKYFNVRYLYSHKTIPTITPTFGVDISKSGVSGGISLSVDSNYRGYPGKHGGVVTYS